jgi:hypothetical protein
MKDEFRKAILTLERKDDVYTFRLRDAWRDLVFYERTVKGNFKSIMNDVVDHIYTMYQNKIFIYKSFNGEQVEKHCINGKKHRLDGPAVIHYNEDRSKKEEFYYIDGIEYKDMFLYSVAVGCFKGDE